MKYIAFILLLFLATVCPLRAQTQSREAIAKVKYNLSDYKNPSNFRNRFGLLKFSPDGKRIAVSSADRDIKILDAETGQALSIIVGDNGGFNAFSFSPDGKSVLTQASTDTEVTLWDADTGKEVRTFKARKRLSANKRLLVTALRQKPKGLEMGNAPTDTAWQSVLVARDEGDFEVIDIKSGEVKQTLQLASKSNATRDFFKIVLEAYFPGAAPFLLSSTSYSPDGKTIVAANGDKTPMLWDAATGSLIAKLEPQTDRVYRTYFTPDSRFVITNDIDGAVKVWNTATGEMTASFGGKKDKNFVVAVNPKINVIATATLGGDARLWNAENGALLQTLQRSAARNIFFKPDGQIAATIHSADKRQLAQLWNAQSGELIATLPRGRGEEQALSLVWSPDEKIFVTASEDAVKIWNNQGELLQTLENAVFPARFSPDGTLLATGGKNHAGYVWQIEQ